MKILFKNIEIVSPLDNLLSKTDLLIVDGIIEKIGDVSDVTDCEIIESSNYTCIPGLFDLHVHFRDPGQTEKEDLLSGIESAANGGFTGVLLMPNTLPPIDDVVVIKDLISRSKNSFVDIRISACISKGRKGESISDFETLLKAGAVAFTDDGSGVTNTKVMTQIFEASSKFNFTVMQHCEDEKINNRGIINKGYISEKLNCAGIDCLSETSMIASDLLLCKSIPGSRYHVQHISCGESAEQIKIAKKNNINVTAEVCPHHFILTDEDVLIYGSNAKMNPPLRTKKSVEKILECIRDDYIDVICTDHAPHTDSEKSKPIDSAPFGIIGLESAVALTYTYLVKKRIISFEKMIELMCYNPRKIINEPIPKISIGEKANLTILDKNEKWKIDKNRFKSKSRNTPFDGFDVFCKPKYIINNNKFFKCSL